MSKNETHHEKGVTTLTKPRVKRPDLYTVVLLNDDYTTMEFVIHVLQKFFHKNQEEATKIMLHVHNSGKGVCGVYPHDVATTKVAEVTDYAKKFEMPLKCIMEKA